METFHIKASSWKIYIATLLTIIFGGGALGIALLPKTGNMPLIYVMSAAVIAERLMLPASLP
jgi:hypothetical protein